MLREIIKQIEIFGGMFYERKSVKLKSCSRTLKLLKFSTTLAKRRYNAAEVTFDGFTLPQEKEQFKKVTRS